MTTNTRHTASKSGLYVECDRGRWQIRALDFYASHTVATITGVGLTDKESERVARHLAESSNALAGIPDPTAHMKAVEGLRAAVVDGERNNWDTDSRRAVRAALDALVESRRRTMELGERPTGRLD